MAQSVNVPGVGTLNFPDGMSQADMAAAIQKNYPEIHGKASSDAPKKSAVDNLLDTAKNAYGSIFEPAASAVTGAIARPMGQVAGLATNAANAAGLTDADGADVQNKVQNAFTYQPQTAGGQAATQTLGKIGDALMGAPSRAAGALAGRGATAVGASPDVAQGVQNGVTEAIPQALNVWGAKALPEGAAANAASTAQQGVDLAPKIQAFQQARAAGYHIPPTEITTDATGPVGLAGKSVTGLGGKDQINSTFALYNQNVTNKIAKAEAGIPANQPLSDATLEAARQKANGAYSAIRSADQNVVPVPGATVSRAAGPVQFDSQFKQDLQGIGAGRGNGINRPPDPAITDIQNRLGNLSAQPPSAVLDEIKTLRADARANLKADDDPAKLNLGTAQKNAADAVEDQLGRYLQNQPALFQQFQAARTQLAKINTIDEAMPTGTGNVNPEKIAAIRERDGGMTGGLAQIADAANNFSRVVKNTKGVQAPEPFSAFRSSIALGGAIAGGNQIAGHAGAVSGGAGALLLGGGPAVRGGLNSDLYQSLLNARAPQPGALTQLGQVPGSPLAGLAIPTSNQQRPQQ